MAKSFISNTYKKQGVVGRVKEPFDSLELIEEVNAR
jgi:hypothetical protein